MVYYSILNSFGQRSQYISIKFSLHKLSDNPLRDIYRDISCLLSINSLDLIFVFVFLCRYFKTQDKPVQMSSTWNGLKLRNATLTLKTMPETPGLHFGLDLPVFPVFPRLLQPRPRCCPQLRRTIVTRRLTQYPRAFASKFFSVLKFLSDLIVFLYWLND